jgi:hypothetical protein
VFVSCTAEIFMFTLLQRKQSTNRKVEVEPKKNLRSLNTCDKYISNFNAILDVLMASKNMYFFSDGLVNCLVTPVGHISI